MKVKSRKATWKLDRTFQEPPPSSPRPSPRRPRPFVRPSAPAPLEEAQTRISNFEFRISTGLQVYWRFFLAGIIHRGQTGAVMPSQRHLVSRMIEPIPEDYDGEIVELGAGTGALTLRLAETRPATRILACEINPVLARDLEARLQAAGLRRRVRVISDPAQQLLSGLSARQAKAPDFIVSGIPLGNLVNARASALVAAIHRALAPGGTYIQFQYSLLDRKKIKNKFARLRIGFVLLNIPPAFVYFAEK